jgi:ubiquinone/menaquinone biosynthesis C-methylase UbiE/predicted nuclease with TOPRIM domain
MSQTDYNAEYREYWSRADRWGSSSFTDADNLASRVLKAAGPGRVLDVGCGMGELVHAFLRQGVDATGVDVAQRCIDDGNRRAPGRFQVGSVLELPFADASFETVVCTDMLEHLEEGDIARALDELVRVAKSTLFVCVSTREDRDKRWHLTIKPREWWERRFIERSVRKHPRSQSVLEYAAIDREVDTGNATLVYEVMPAAVARAHPLESLEAERDLHTDMLREAGRRSDAHVARYQLAAQYVRPNDRVLDVSCGLGYGSAILWANAEPERVQGIDLSASAVAYADANYALQIEDESVVAFGVGDAHDLSGVADSSVDLVVSFETLEHLREPEMFLAEAHRVLTPGGRFIASVPNDWTDETGKDPNPEHLHVYDWDRLASQVAERFLVEAAFSQIAGGGMKLTDARRSLSNESVQPDGTGPSGKAEWWLVVGMKDPVGAEGSKDANRHFPVLENDEAFHVTNFARDYDNPWLVRSMVSIGLRAESDAVLSSIASRTLETARPGSPDEGAALCVLAYQHLKGNDSAGDLGTLLERIEAYPARADDSSHAWRWCVSNQYVAGCLLLKAGRRSEAKEAHARCAAMDPCRFSPLLATKTIASCFEAGMISIAEDDRETARSMWQRGVEEAQRVLARSWTNIVGSSESPLSFGLSEACEVLDAASRCSWALHVHQAGTDRAGYAWEASHKRSPLSDLRWLRELSQAKEWHESQHANWRRLAIDRERDVKHWSDAAESLRSGKAWLEAERSRLREYGRASEQTIEALRAWIDEQEQGKKWLDEQRQQLLDAVGKRDQTIEELRAWIREQDSARAMQEAHVQRHVATIEQMHARITELSAWSEEQEKGRTWLDEQRAMLLEMNSSCEEQLRETRAWIAELEERCRTLQAQYSGVQEQCRSLQLEVAQNNDQLANLRAVHATITASYYELLDRLNRALQPHFGVRKSVREIVNSIAPLDAHVNGQGVAPEQSTQISEDKSQDHAHKTSETEQS